MTQQGWLRIMMIAAILSIFFAFPGCGKKGDPIPLKETSPKVISDYTIESLSYR